jgi:succinate dehydrogenase / fumarate reductase, cytochrome b subunit
MAEATPSSQSQSLTLTQSQKQRPVYTNLNVFKDLTGYRLPPAGWVSILHRASGAGMFLLLPLLVWLFDKSLTSEISFVEFQNAFRNGLGIFPGWFIKLVVIGLVWAYLHHFIAGVRHLWMDMFHAVSKQQGHNSALFTLIAAPALTLLVALKMFGVF